MAPYIHSEESSASRSTLDHVNNVPQIPGENLNVPNVPEVKVPEMNSTHEPIAIVGIGSCRRHHR